MPPRKHQNRITLCDIIASRASGLEIAAKKSLSPLPLTYTENGKSIETFRATGNKSSPERSIRPVPSM